jgi:hypothetical protein
MPVVEPTLAPRPALAPRARRAHRAPRCAVGVSIVRVKRNDLGLSAPSWGGKAAGTGSAWLELPHTWQLGGAEPARAERAGTERAAAEPAGTERAAAERAGTERAGTAR